MYIHGTNWSAIGYIILIPRSLKIIYGQKTFSIRVTNMTFMSLPIFLVFLVLLLKYLTDRAETFQICWFDHFTELHFSTALWDNMLIFMGQLNHPNVGKNLKLILQ